MQLRVDLGLASDADARELEEASLELREELLELDVDAVKRPPAGPAPEGAKAVEATLVGALLVTAGRDAIGAVVRTIQGWVARGRDRRVKLQLGGDSIELTAASADEQRRLLEAFLARHAP